MPALSHPAYAPPTSSAISVSQNETPALRLLLAQRILYSRAKKWLAVRMWGMGFIAIAAPPFALIWPRLATVIGGIAAIWIFLGRSSFSALERRITAQAALVQEMFDVKVFAMPDLAVRSPSISLEEISNAAGQDKTISANAKKHKLIDWYPIDTKSSGLVTIAISQRANASYSKTLLQTTSRYWFALICGWAIILMAVSAVIGLSIADFLLGVAFPLLLAFLDTWEFWRKFLRASKERENLTVEIEDKLKSKELAAEDLIIWQTRMYELRRNMPLVPDWIYDLKRKKNERAMKSVAAQLSAISKDDSE